MGAIASGDVVEKQPMFYGEGLKKTSLPKVVRPLGVGGYHIDVEQEIVEDEPILFGSRFPFCAILNSKKRPINGNGCCGSG